MHPGEVGLPCLTASLQLPDYLSLGDLYGLSSVAPISQILSPEVSSLVPTFPIPTLRAPFAVHFSYLDPLYLTFP